MRDLQTSASPAGNLQEFQVMNSELEAYFSYYSDPSIYMDPTSNIPLSASTTKCCATGTCDNICPIS